ncbi:hypothetical protein DFQ30_005898, partial [Apophysomyces sp. BC1015]
MRGQILGVLDSDLPSTESARRLELLWSTVKPTLTIWRTIGTTASKKCLEDNLLQVVTEFQQLNDL